MGLINVIKTANDIQKAKKFLASKSTDIEKAKKLIESLKKALEYLDSIKIQIVDVINSGKTMLKELKAIKEGKDDNKE